MCWENYFKVVDDFTSYEQRLLSFKNWKGSLNPTVLAYAGFYFTQHKDICKCAYCSIEMGQWRKSDCPVEEHQKFNRHCNFNNIIWKDKIFVKQQEQKKGVNIYNHNSNKFYCIVLLLLLIHIMWYNYKWL